MTFNSLQYALFLPAVVALHWLAPQRFRLPLLLVASYVFYAWWEWRFVGLLVFVTTVDWAVGRALGARSGAAPDPEHNEKVRKRLVAVSVVANLGLLGYFKYAGFFVSEATAALESLGLVAEPVVLSILLPIGISFFVFQSLGYVIDVYRGQVEPCRSWVEYATFVAFFPQLVAGPISRVGSLLPQLRAAKPLPAGEHIGSGLLLIVRGLLRKVVIADQLAPIVDEGFSQAAGASRWFAFAVIIGFAVQIYADFAAYTDIARGSARLFGIQLVHNFRQPYLAPSVTAFWRRWHISLSTWLRDYLYVPLGGNRGGRWRTARNLMLTMLLGGFWHGAAWGFIIWGGLHGLFLVVERFAGVRPERSDTEGWPGLRRLPHVVLTFVAVAGAFVFFRAVSAEEAFEVFGSLFAGGPVGLGGSEAALLILLVAGSALVDAAEIRFGSSMGPFVRHPLRTGFAVGMTLVAVLLASGADPTPFLYFQF